jgi:ferredoxin
VNVAPDLFELDDTGVVAFRAEIGEMPDERVVEGCQVCPVEALTVCNAKGEELV